MDKEKLKEAARLMELAEQAEKALNAIDHAIALEKSMHEGSMTFGVIGFGMSYPVPVALYAEMRKHWQKTYDYYKQQFDSLWTLQS